MNFTSQHWITQLQLEKHPEGGHYRRIYQSQHLLRHNQLERPISTGIYYLLQAGEFSAFHKLDADERWFYHAGGELIIHMIDNEGAYRQQYLSATKGVLQATVPEGVWFAAELVNPEEYVLASCMVSPGFLFETFELARVEVLQKLCPQQAELINRLCV